MMLIKSYVDRYPPQAWIRLFKGAFSTAIFLKYATRENLKVAFDSFQAANTPANATFDESSALGILLGSIVFFTQVHTHSHKYAAHMYPPPHPPHTHTLLHTHIHTHTFIHTYIYVYIHKQRSLNFNRRDLQRYIREGDHLQGSNRSDHAGRFSKRRCIYWYSRPARG